MMERLFVSLLLFPALALSQASLVPDGGHSLGVGFGTTYERHLALRFVGTTLTLFGRVDLEFASGTLANTRVPGVKDLEAWSFAATYVFLRSERQRLFAAIRYARMSTDVTYEVPYAIIASQRSVTLTSATTSFALIGGVTAGPEGGVHAVPTVVLMVSDPSNDAKEQTTRLLVGVNMGLMFRVTDSWSLIPYAGAVHHDGAASYEIGVRVAFAWPRTPATAT